MYYPPSYNSEVVLVIISVESCNYKYQASKKIGQKIFTHNPPNGNYIQSRVDAKTDQKIIAQRRNYVKINNIH